MKVARRIPILFLLSPIIFIILFLIPPNPHLYLFYIYESWTTQDQERKIAECGNVSWTLYETDAAYVGRSPGLDQGAVQPQLLRNSTLTGSIDGINLLSITPYLPGYYGNIFIKVKKSAPINITAYPLVRPTDYPFSSLVDGRESQNITVINQSLYNHAVVEDFGVNGPVSDWIVILPKNSTLSVSQFDEIARCYQKNESQLNSAFPIKIAAFVRL